MGKKIKQTSCIEFVLACFNSELLFKLSMLPIQHLANIYHFVIDPCQFYKTISCGIGACSSIGQLECQNGVESDSCSPGTPQPEGPYLDPTCLDSLDNDCDGNPDAADIMRQWHIRQRRDMYSLFLSLSSLLTFPLKGTRE